MAGCEASKSHTNPNVFYNSPGSLATIAASNVALICWHQQLLTTYVKKDDDFRDTWFITHTFSGGDIFPMSNAVRNLLDYQIKRLGIEFYDFIYFYVGCIPAKDEDDVANFLKNVVVDGKGVLSYQSTAKKLLSSGKLNAMEQYWLACVFCFEEEIERLWPSVSEQVCIEDGDMSIYMGLAISLGEKRETLHMMTLNYWTYRMRNELHKVPGNKRASAEYRVVSSGKVYVWSEMEYFWSRLTPNQQISQIRRILADWNLNRNFVKCMLPKLTLEQLKYALKDDLVPRGILYALAIDELDYSLVLQLWNFMKDSITYVQFFEVLKNLLKLGFADNLEHRILTSHVSVLLFEIWRTAPEYLKKEISQRNVEVFFSSFLKHDKIENYDFRWYGRDLRFHLDLLANVGVEMRRKIWLASWPDFVLLAKGHDLEKFLKLCFNTESDIFQFKEQKMMNFKLLSSHFDKFVELGFTDELVRYLEFCSSDVNRVRNMRQRIIESNLLKMHNFKFDVLVKFGDFIGNSFPSPDLANQFRKKLIRERLESWYDLLDKSCLKGVKNILVYFLSSKPNLLTVAKQKCYERCQNYLKTGTFINFNLREWQDFLEWCAPSKEDLAQFKKSLHIDHLFNVLLAKVVKGQLATSSRSKYRVQIIEDLSHLFPDADVAMSLRPFKNFLQWYFESDQAVKTYKLSKIYNYKQISAIKDMFRDGNRTVINCILKFLFHDDEEARKNFIESFFV